MKTINKRYIVDEKNRKIAVQIPIEAFDKIEEILENYALVQLMKENEGDETLSANEAETYYNQLKKHNERSVPKKIFERAFKDSF